MAPGSRGIDPTGRNPRGLLLLSVLRTDEVWNEGEDVLLGLGFYGFRRRSERVAIRALAGAAARDGGLGGGLIRASRLGGLPSRSCCRHAD